MVGRAARFRRPSWATAPTAPPEEEEYVTTDGETPPPPEAASMQGQSTPSSSQNSANGITSSPRRSTRSTSKTLKRNPVVPTRSPPRLLAHKGGGAAARQRIQMESLSESSDSTTTSFKPDRGWQTPEAAKIPLPPSTVPTPMVSGRYKTPKRGSAGRKLDDMGVSSGIMGPAVSSHRPSTEKRREERKVKAPSSMLDEESFGEERPPWEYLFSQARDTTQTRLPRGRSSRRERRMADPNSNETLAEFFGPLLLPLQFAWYLIKNFLGFLRAPLIWIFCIYVAAVLTAYAGRQTTKVLVSSITALCWLPGVTEFELLPFCRAPRSRSDEEDGGAWSRKPELPSVWNLFSGPQYPTPNFRQLVELQGSYSGVLENSEMGAVIGVHLKAAHASITDLSTVVRLSKLRSRGQLVAHLDEFAEGAKAAADELSRFQGRVGVEIDILLAVNEWTVRNLEEAKKREAEIEASRLTSGLTGLVLAPFRIAEMQAIQRQVRDIFLGASQRLEKGLEELVLRADSIYDHMESLDDKLIAIHEVAVEADEKLAEDQERILESLWSRFYHRKDLNEYEDHRKKLEAVTLYRGIARNKVSETTLDLQIMLELLRELRRSVSQPILEDKIESESEEDGDNGAKKKREKMNVGSIPLEVHIDAVTKGAKRLLEDRNRAKERLKEDLRRARNKELSRIRGEKPVEYPERLERPKQRRVVYTETESSQPDPPPPPPPRKEKSEGRTEESKRVEEITKRKVQENPETKKRKGFAIYSFTQLPGASTARKTPNADEDEFEGLKRRQRR